MNTHWSQIQEVGAITGMRVMFFIYRYLGRWAFELCLYPVITYFYLTRPSARKASTDFLRTMQDNGAIDPNLPLGRLSFQHFLQFGRILLDKLAAWSGAFNYKNVVFNNRVQFLEMVDRGEGALVIVSHLGNLEVCRALADLSKRIKLNILVHTRHAQKFNRLLREVDRENHLHLIQVSEITPATTWMLKQKLEQGEVIFIAGDRTPASSHRTVMARFFSRPAPFPVGPYILASVLRCPVYLLFCVKKNKHYRVYFEEFSQRLRLQRQQRDEQIEAYAQQYATRLEAYTREHPLQWTNFYNFWNQSKP